MADSDINAPNAVTATVTATSLPTAAKSGVETLSSVVLPRITIKFCTQCKWNLRAAYYAQEVLQTFSTSLGEVALIPATGGTFEIRIFYAPAKTTESTTTATTSPAPATEDDGVVKVLEKVLWDRKIDGGFPETKELKGRVRDVIEPGRGLGHTDRALAKNRVKDRKEEAEKEQYDTVKERTEEESTGVSGGNSLVCTDCS